MENKKISPEQLLRQLESLLPGPAQRDALQQSIFNLVQKGLDKLDIVTLGEFEASKQSLDATQQRLQKLENVLDQLLKDLESAAAEQTNLD